MKEKVNDAIPIPIESQRKRRKLTIESSYEAVLQSLNNSSNTSSICLMQVTNMFKLFFCNIIMQLNLLCHASYIV